jgi:hypothetical protein
MAAPIYAARLAGYYATALPKTKTTWDQFREDAMRASLRDAKELWGIIVEKA